MPPPPALPDDALPIAPDGDLAALLLRLPGPLPLALSGAALLGGAFYTWFGLSGPLALLALPLAGLGLTGAALAGFKLWLRGRMRAIARAQAEARGPQASQGEVERVETLLAEADQALSVAAIGRLTALEHERVVLALGVLDARGALTEDLDETDGTFRYRLADDAPGPDDDSHVSLRDRLERVRR
ncbi:MAG: hypothetical protein H6704_05145 [Myxococcales bacterium]|nr:hypothetical protein [Myxococcales bacterium]